MTTTADNGRIYLSKELREKFGEKFHIVEKGDKIVLVPVSDNPLETLRNEFGDIDKSVKQMKKEALETAMDEAGR
jgi:bifunctional DNA-binding transcriptional regulator/antitoxin component of YhaV-PrlF toxin-antitoxin module